MNTETAAMRGRLAEARIIVLELSMKMDGMCNHIRRLLNPCLTSVADMDIALADALMDELVRMSGELTVAENSAARIEKELK